MKVTLTFELEDDIVNQRDAIRLLKSQNMASLIFELQHNLYNKTSGKSGIEVCEYVKQLIKDYNLDNTDEYTV
jgi:hypothetical protein